MRVRKTHLVRAQKVPHGASGSERQLQVCFWLMVGVEEAEKGWVHMVRLAGVK